MSSSEDDWEAELDNEPVAAQTKPKAKFADEDEADSDEERMIKKEKEKKAA
jgi:hypothetical protein